MNNLDPLYCGKFYHIYNHAVGDENLFRERENYFYFLRKYSEYIYPVCKTYVWCLLPNHFHFLIKVRREDQVTDFFKLKKKKPISSNTNLELHSFVMQCFSNFFNCYAKSYNNCYKRRGALFNDYLKRKEVVSEKYFSRLAFYIHNNPVHHGFCRKMFDWEFSSIHSILTSKATKLERETVVNWYGNTDLLIEKHRNGDYIFSRKEMDELEFV